MRAGGVIHIGCSGWQYRHWRGTFYPPELPQTRWFAHYALQFDTVEINSSFYRLPEASTFATWREQAPPHFVYSVKASRFLTHMRKLKDPRDPLARFFDRARHLGPHLGPVLYQLPPHWPLDLDRLRGLPPRRCGACGRIAMHVVEFRDPSWYDDRVLALLDSIRVTLCLHDMPGSAQRTLVDRPVRLRALPRRRTVRRRVRRRPARRVERLADTARCHERRPCARVFQQRHRWPRTTRRYPPATAATTAAGGVR